MVKPQRAELIGIMHFVWDGLHDPTELNPGFWFNLLVPRHISKLFSDARYPHPLDFKDGTEFSCDVDGAVAWELVQARKLGRLRLKVVVIAQECTSSRCEETGCRHRPDYEVESFTVLGWT